MTVRALLLLALAPLAAAGEDLLDRARELSDDGDLEGRQICLRVLAERPTEMRAWVELYRGMVLPRDREPFDAAERIRADWAQRARGEAGPIVAQALSLLLVKDAAPTGTPNFTIVIGTCGQESHVEGPAEAVVRRAEQIAPDDPWVVWARFVADCYAPPGQCLPRGISERARPVLRALERDPSNIVLLEGLASFPPSPEARDARRRLEEVAARHPRLRPWFALRAACLGGLTDIDALERVLEETRRDLPDSRYLDDILFRLGDAYQHQKRDPRAARRCFEEAIRLDRGNYLGPCCLALSDLLVDDFNDTQGAVDLLLKYHGRKLGSYSDPVFNCCPGRVLFRVGELLRNRLSQHAEAAKRFEEGIQEAEASQSEVGSYLYYYIATGDCLMEVGRYRAAMTYYDRYRALAQVENSEISARWMKCYLLVSPYFTISMGLTALLTALSAILGMVVLVSRFARARRYVRLALLLTLLAGGTQVCVQRFLLRVHPMELLWTGFLAMRTFLVVPAGMVFAASVGIRSPRAARTVRSVLAGLAAAAVMGAVTAVFLQVGHPRPSELLTFLWDPVRDGELGAILRPHDHPIAAVLLVMAAGVVEELTCRLFFLGLLVRSLRRVRHRWPISIALVSLFWAAAHAGMVEPEAWKLAQVFTLGLVLGVLARREGILACMVAHAAFNAVGVWL